jgi:hypothetical protein
MKLKEGLEEEFYRAWKEGKVKRVDDPVIDRTMAVRIATQLRWIPINNIEWKYHPMTGEPLIDGWPLYSGLPQREWVGLTNEEMFYIYGQNHVGKLCNLGRLVEAKLKEKNSTTERNIQTSDKIPVKSSHLEGHTMNNEYTAGEAEAWINGHRVGKNQGEQLRLAVKEFFEDYLDVVEESDSGRLFHPITVSCCRALKTEPLEKLLVEMRKRSGAKSKDENHE